ncbi:ATP-binding cassette domain-containing protein [Streptococcus equi subsp. zooepidemicus]|uniref:ATP-binding cassette domain-containing protein n=3 Tax=Streptococcus equi TaxID=1336 RepID=A0A6M1KNT7_9STRE|nr:ATP-binding cassette domain-containing protein [Streptococcus equi subsp. zooepidemicus]NGL84210.1 ATP-binding cassette domain-containing protein [Streptococcus equi subsp. ruminatorum]QTZ56158.1 ABC transporter ATP-binding protein YtrB [Streptococcus equi subsp. zooepidemicus]HEL0705534.1 ATP-binding cassette domain-containing protein [Streptococcus equi subsp. zooepidemicus]HEL1320257.1 ATP-binding cassette domain-containing protein [Streptococcus equi subsp. zooepidemicus]
MLRIEHGRKLYKGNLVLDDINLTFKEGNIYGLVGINGSGKTLILKALAGYIKLDEGAVYQDDKKIRQYHNYIEDAGVLIENPEFIAHLTLLQNLELLRSISPKARDIDLAFWLDVYHLHQFSQTAFKHLSLGTKKKLGLIQALMHHPKILILDEPMNALDDRSVEQTKKLLLDVSKNGLVILSSHLKTDIEDLCDEVVHVAEGKIV